MNNVLCHFYHAWDFFEFYVCDFGEFWLYVTYLYYAVQFSYDNVSTFRGYDNVEVDLKPPKVAVISEFSRFFERKKKKT